MNLYICDVVQIFMNELILSHANGAEQRQLQLVTLFVCVTLITYCHEVKRGSMTFWLFRNLRRVIFNSKYPEHYYNKQSYVKLNTDTHLMIKNITLNSIFGIHVH